MAVPDLVVELLEAEVRRLRAEVERRERVIRGAWFALDTTKGHLLNAQDPPPRCLPSPKHHVERALERVQQGLDHINAGRGQ